MQKDNRTMLNYIKYSLLILLIFFAYGRVLPLLWVTWYRDDYSHGILVPFISLYLIWVDRDKLKNIRINPNYWIGFFVIVTSAFLLVTGVIGSIVTFQEYSLLVIIPGLIIFFWGVSYLKALVVPVSYLILMVPFLDPLMEYIHKPLQISTAVMSSIFLDLLNVPLLRSGQYIELPNAMLDVAKECSGLQFLIAMIAIAIPMVHLTQRVLWKKIVLLVSAILIGLISNWVRVTFVALWTYYTGQFSHGPIHTFKGMLVAVVGFVLLFAEAKILNRSLSSYTENKQIPDDKTQIIYKDRKFSWGWSVILLQLFLGMYLFFFSFNPVPLQVPLNELSLHSVGHWKGKQIANYDVPLRILDADSEITMTYENKEGNNINVYVGYLNSQNQGKELVHDSLNQIVDGADQIKISSNTDELFNVNRKLIEYNKEKYLLLFWYNINGRALANKYFVKIYSILDGVIHARNNGAIIMIFVPLQDVADLKKVENIQIDLLSNLYPVINKSLPGI